MKISPLRPFFELRKGIQQRDIKKVAESLPAITALHQRYGNLLITPVYLGITALGYRNLDSDEYKHIMNQEISGQVVGLTSSVFLKNFICDIILFLGRKATLGISNPVLQAVFHGSLKKEFENAVLYVGALITHGIVRPTLNRLGYEQTKNISIWDKLINKNPTLRSDTG